MSRVTLQVILWYRGYPQKVYPICQLIMTDRNRIASPVAGGTAGIPTWNEGYLSDVQMQTLLIDVVVHIACLPTQ